MVKKFIFCFILCLVLLTLPVKTFASENSFVTIVNPVRISQYIKTPGQSLYAEYQQIESRNLPATWLLTYDALKNSDVMKVVASFDDKQELGIFLEVSSNFAADAGVKYNARDSWHRATSVFLSGYFQGERKKLVDTVFQEFKKKFGYYPKSVGSWWTDSYTLDYISKKYGVTSNLSVSDQFTLDGYTVWGTPWSMPYYPSNINAAIPAKGNPDKTNIVMLRWAPRDPLNGYKSPTANNASMYSPQDYSTIGLPDEYFRKIASFYLTTQPHNNFSNFTFGLESDTSPETFSSSYSQRLDDVINIAQNNGSKILTTKDFAQWYMQQFKGVSPSQLVVSDDLLGSEKKAFWFQNSNYRAGFIYDEKAKTLTIRDMRSYYKDLEEPFYKSPNKQNNLFIALPFIIDSVIERSSARSFKCGDYLSVFLNEIRFSNCDFKFHNNSLELVGQGILFSDLGQNYVIPKEGVIFDKIGFTVPYGLLRRIPLYLLDYIPFVAFAVLLLFILGLFKFSNVKIVKLTILILFVTFLLFLGTKQKVYISQSEMDALLFLQRLPQGKVIVFNKNCLKCSWQTEFEPAAMAGYKKYVMDVTGKPVYEDLKLPLAKSVLDIKNVVKQRGASYIYLAKYEDYIEELPYPPSWAGLNVVYENANAQILKVVK